jgi:hypothetical protein
MKERLRRFFVRKDAEWVPGIVGLGSQLSIVRSVPRMAGSDDLGAYWADFLLWVAKCSGGRIFIL